MVTHVVFTLNNWGELMLEPSLCPHEFNFARSHLAHQIATRDVHLVGEFVEVVPKKKEGELESDIVVGVLVVVVVDIAIATTTSILFFDYFKYPPSHTLSS